MNARNYAILLVVSVVATVGGILTLIPAAGASYPNVLGYRSLCTFAPAATLYCFAIAGASCVIRASLVKRKALYGKPIVKPAAVAVVGAVLVLAVASTVWFVAVKSSYPDGQSAPTATEAAADPTGTSA